MKSGQNVMSGMANMRNGNNCSPNSATALTRILLLAGVIVVGLIAKPVSPLAQQGFKTPEEAVDALIGAVRAKDPGKVIEVLGPAGRPIVQSGDDVADQNIRDEFLAAYDKRKSIDKSKPDSATLVVGPGDWPFPIPLTKQGDQWRFDTIAGRYEILYRRIGRNELNAIETCFAYVEAQSDYAEFAKKEFGTTEYAQRIVSSSGKKDGLYWPATNGKSDSPLGELFADATDEGYSIGATPIPYHGYYFKILKRQGPNAPGGVANYVVRGKMTDGFALVAWPAEYGNSGVKTFLVNQLGIVFEKDLGRDTPQIVTRMTYFNPDQTWKRYSR